MKPTLDLIPREERDWSVVDRKLGRPTTDQEKWMCICIWAGQAGHEKCGWCENCHNPRLMTVKGCKHLNEHIYKGWT